MTTCESGESANGSEEAHFVVEIVAELIGDDCARRGFDLRAATQI